MLVVGPAVFLPIALAALRVVGTSTCPTAAQVEAQLASLPRSPDSAALAVVERVEASLRLRLYDERGALLGERLLTLTGSCTDLAAVAAVVLASWAPVPPSATPPAPHLVLTSRLPPEPDELPLRPRWGLQIGLGLAASAVLGRSVALAPEVRLFAALALERSRWQSWAALDFMGDRSLALAGGQVQWRRSDLGAGIGYCLLCFYPRLEAEAGALFSLLQAHGVDFGRNQGATAVDLGLEAGLRLVFPANAWAFWLGLSLDAWPFPHHLQVLDSSEESVLPQLTGWGGVGLALRLE